MTNKTTKKFSPEVRERAVRMVLEHEGEHSSRWAAVTSIAAKIGCTGQTLNEWVKKAEVDSGRRAGEAKAGIGEYFAFYNERRLHQAHGYRPPMAVWRDGTVQTCGHVNNPRALTTGPQEEQQSGPLAT